MKRLMIFIIISLFLAGCSPVVSVKEGFHLEGKEESIQSEADEKPETVIQVIAMEIEEENPYLRAFGEYLINWDAYGKDRDSILVIQKENGNFYNCYDEQFSLIREFGYTENEDISINNDGSFSYHFSSEGTPVFIIKDKNTYYFAVKMTNGSASSVSDEWYGIYNAVPAEFITGSVSITDFLSQLEKENIEETIQKEINDFTAISKDWVHFTGFGPDRESALMTKEFIDKYYADKVQEKNDKENNYIVNGYIPVLVDVNFDRDPVYKYFLMDTKEELQKSTYIEEDIENLISNITEEIKEETGININTLDVKETDDTEILKLFTMSLSFLLEDKHGNLYKYGLDTSNWFTTEMEETYMYMKPVTTEELYDTYKMMLMDIYEIEEE